MVTYDLVAIIAMCLVVLYFQRAGGALVTYRGIRVITCPATGQPAAVQLAAWRAALRSVIGNPPPRIHGCSGWPERRNCDQACAVEIAAAPADSLVPNILARWYQDRACVCCGAALQQVHMGRHQPCLMSPERKMIEWKDIPPEKIPQILPSAAPVCWKCLVAETHTR
jgi:hypothetical protein